MNFSSNKSENYGYNFEIAAATAFQKSIDVSDNSSY